MVSATNTMSTNAPMSNAMPAANSTMSSNATH
jgi:hypothetical protein